MRILWIKTELLHPVDKGGKIRTYQMLRSLARRHEVTYLCLDDGQAAPDARTRAREYSTKVITVPFSPVAKHGAAFVVDLLRNLLSTLPYAVARYRNAELGHQIAELAPGHDLVVCDFLAPSANVGVALGTRCVLFQHNVEAQIWQRHADIPQNPIRRLYMREQWRRMRRFEQKECRRFDHVLAVSEQDAAIMRDSYGVADVSAIRTGVDVEYFARCNPAAAGGQNLVFVGSMDWMPNDDGIRWFAAEVFPLVKARHPDASLTVVGRAPSAGMLRLAQSQPGIEVTGTVDDVRPYLHRAAMSVVPLRIGGGTRLKIYEAMAAGVPVVSTAIGAEGLPIKHGEHLLVADSAQDQAAAISTLLSDRNMAGEIAGTALRFVQLHCSWDAVTDEFLKACTS
jgi:sugar transferase (PEP-CTERM/EpsH1 system associated)